MIGLDPKTYWETTPKQFEKMVEVYVEKEEQRAKELDYNNFNLGKYVAFAFNNPKKYPKRPFSERVTAMTPMTEQDMERVMRHNTLLLGGTIKHGNHD
jgi:hypothetical protein